MNCSYGLLERITQVQESRKITESGQERNMNQQWGKGKQMQGMMVVRQPPTPPPIPINKKLYIMWSTLHCVASLVLWSSNIGDRKEETQMHDKQKCICKRIQLYFSLSEQYRLYSAAETVSHANNNLRQTTENVVHATVSPRSDKEKQHKQQQILMLS